jgi:hypothetical protein
MFDVLEFWHALSGAVDWLPIPERMMGLPTEAVSVSAVFSGSGTVILSKFTSNVGAITMPLNYCALFVGALFGNWLLQGTSIPLANHIQTSMVFAVAGMTVMALTMMCFLRSEEF